jgi:hypothetical protein
MSRSAISSGHRGPITGRQADRCAICDHMRRWHSDGDLTRCTVCPYPSGPLPKHAIGTRYHAFAEPRQEEP